MAKDRFLFYQKWMDAIRDLPSDLRLEILESIVGYACSGNIPVLKTNANIAFNFIKQDIDRDAQAYINTCAKNRENGSKGARYGISGGRPRKEETPKNPQKPPKTPNGVLKPPKTPDIDTDIDTDIDKESEERKKEEISSNEDTKRAEISFEEFWDLYDKKKGDRGKLQKKWEKLRESERLAIMEYIPKYKLETPNKQYRKNPETFLNNKAWNDEIITEEISKPAQSREEWVKKILNSK